MAEGEIYRKSGENERIGSISGSPIEKTLPSDNPDALDYPASEDKDIEEIAAIERLFTEEYGEQSTNLERNRRCYSFRLKYCYRTI